MTTSSPNPEIPSTMRAAQYSSIVKNDISQSLRYTTTAKLPISSVAQLKQGQILVKIHAVSLNPVDHTIPETSVVGKLSISRPAIPGLDFAGEVAGVGPDDQPNNPQNRFAVGDRVFGRQEPFKSSGTLAEYAIVMSQKVVHLPDGVTMIDAATLPTAGTTPYENLVPYLNQAATGQSVFIHGGSGGIGSMGIQIAKILGCYVATSCSTANVQKCRDLGADMVIDYRSINVADALIASGRKFDLIWDCVGAPADLYWKCSNFTTPNANYTQSGGKVSFEHAKNIIARMIWPTFLGAPRVKFTFTNVAVTVEELERLGQWMKEGRLKAIIDRTYPLDQANEAFARLKSPSSSGKVVVKVVE